MKYVVEVHRGDSQKQIEETKDSMLQVIEEITYALKTLEDGVDWATNISVELIAETQEELAEMNRKWRS